VTALRAVRVGVAAFFLLYLLSVVWPGGLLFAHAEPLVLGLPFSFFWPSLLVVLGFGALVLLYWAEERAAGGAEEPAAGRTGAEEGLDPNGSVRGGGPGRPGDVR